jgi:hypothetical protein
MIRTTHAHISLRRLAALCGLLSLIGIALLFSPQRTTSGKGKGASASRAAQKGEPPLPPHEQAARFRRRPVPSNLPRPLAAGGPDAFGYKFITNQPPAPTIPFNFVDISTTGTILLSGPADNISTTAVLALPFTFYGTPYNALQVAVNGYISTDLTDLGSDLTPDCPLPTPPSSPLDPITFMPTNPGRIYALHGDLILEDATSNIRQQFFPVCPRTNDITGTPEACTVIMWNNVEFVCEDPETLEPVGCGPQFDFEVILYHTTNEILVQIAEGNPDDGTNTTTGIQNPGATSGLAAACPGMGSAPDPFAVAFIPPCTSLMCPANITVANTPNQCGAVVNYTPATPVGGSCGTIICSPAPGSFFQVGTTPVTCTSTMGAMGAMPGPSCTFTVTVQDTQPPTITCPANIRTTAESPTGGPVAFPAPTVSDNCPGVGTPVCTPASGSNFPIGTTTVTCTVSDASPNSPDASCSFTVTLTIPPTSPVGPGAPFPSTSEVSDQKAGSVLVYNFYSSSAASPNTQNTRISITNTNPTAPIGVHLFFVDGATCSVADVFLCLTKNQTASFLASDLDPGTTGYLVAIASDPTTGCPVNFNFLIGDEYVKLASGHAANLGAEAFSALAGGRTACDGNSVTATLAFDGVSYNRVPRTLAASSIPARADGNDTLLVLNRFGGNLATGAGTLSNLFGIFYDDAENALSFTFNPGTCQFRSSLSNNFPRLTPRFENFIPAGRSGWMRLYSTSDIGLLGAVLNFNANAGTNAGAFNQGRNLHKLTLTATQTLVIPIFPANCLD